MDSPAENEANPSEHHGLKRKRSSSKNSSDEDCSGSDEGEYELFTKYFVSNCEKGKTKSVSQIESELPSFPINKPIISRKRKFFYKNDALQLKKMRKFYFLSESMTKPRKPRTSKPAEVESDDKQQHIIGRKQKLNFANVDENGNVYLMHRSYMKSDLFFNDEKKGNYETLKKQDLSFYIVDEIALEGLDGITLEAFWKRLKNVFPNNISKIVADRIWRMICNNKRINFYILQEPREKLIAFDRCKYMDIDSGVFVEPFIEFKDIYPLSSINGTEVRGSCATYHTRKENNGVRRFSIEKVTKLYDQRLVFVADQVLRNKALINEEADPNIELMDLEYCMLERIGRSREQGEFTQGKMSLHYPLNDSKSVYHNRKVLSQNFLIVNQFFYVKSLTSQQNISGGLVHLPRFYNKRKTKQIVIMEQIANLLREKPNYQIELQEFRKIFGRHRFIIKLLKTADFRRFFKIYTFPYRKLYPNATKNEYLHKSGLKERQVKILRMIDPAANLTAIMEARTSKESPHEQIKSDSSGHKLFNYEYLRDIFLYILSTGRVGVTIQEIFDHFKMDFYSVRMAVRKLLLRNVIDSHKIDLGRQQSLKFYAKCFNNPNCVIETQPKVYQLSQATLTRVLKGYEKIVGNDSVQLYSETKSQAATTPPQTTFPLNIEPFCCTAFLTETVDPTEELTIYDIVVKGRDKLLLIQSNLFAHYISEWDDFLLKRDDFSKTAELLQSGFGKVIHDYLSTIRISANIDVDNCIVFSIDVITPETKIGKLLREHRVIELDLNFFNPHSNSCYVDSASKIYLFEAMFNEFHLNNQVMEKLKNVFDRIMLNEGKKKKEQVQLKVEPKIEVEIANNVIMEKFMGPDPVLKFTELNSDGIKTEIFASTEPVAFKEFGAMYTTDDVNLTQRYINRANLILKTVYEETIVKDVVRLFKDIRKEEDQEGYDKKVCKKSINSILTKLVSEGYIKIFKVVMTGKTTTRTQTFICLPFIDTEHSFIKSTIEQLKLKFYVSSGQNQNKTIKVKKKIDSPFSFSDVKDSIIELKQMTSSKIDSDYKFNKKIGKVYGFSPKFVRMRVLHEYLFYVVRELTAVEPLTHKQVFELCKSLKIKVAPNDVTDMPPVYRKEVSWKMFIPALPVHNNWPKGWALACDIILRMPLSVFVKVYNISYEIPELEAHLKHPIKRHFLLKYLPVSARNVLLHKRKYFHSIYEILSHLCYVGLLQLGPRNFKEKDQVFIYVNYRASLYDTCSSKPGYNQIEEKKYKKFPFEFKSGSDVEVYWSEMLRICMNTPLGKRKILDGQCVTIEDCNSKPQMMDTLKAKTFEGAVENDNGKVPGDRRGAAGFDSSLWSFVKRNWIWNAKLESKASRSLQSQVTGLKKEKFDTVLPQPIQFDLLPKEAAAERKVYLKPIKKIKKPSVQSIIVKRNSKKKLVRKIVAPRTKRVREYYDAIDKEIMTKNTQIRVDWDEEEDQLLRYCRAASVFLCPVFKKQFIPYNIIRDVLHRLYPKSRNKTARAIQRRIYLLLMSDEIIKIMETNVENFLNSDTISKYFDQIHNRYKYDIKITDSQMYISFIYLMSYIYKHRKEIELLLLGYIATVDFFSDPYIPLFEVILENVENENLSSIYSNPKTTEDITKDTIKSVIHCSMACKKNNTGWAFQLFHIYKKFSDELIRITVADLKKGQFLVVNKNYEEKSVANNWHTPLKFSHLYHVSKNSTYTIAMFLEAYRNFSSILAQESAASNFISYNELNSFWEKTAFVFEIPEMGIILNPEIEDHSEVIEELAKRFRLYLVKIHERMNGSKSKNKDDVVPLEEKREHLKDVEKDVEEIKNDVRNLIFRIPYLLEGTLELYFKKMLETNCSLEVNNYICLIIVDLKQFAINSNPVEELIDFISNIEDEVVIEDSKKLVKSLSKIVFAIQNIHQQDVCGSSESFYEDRFKLWEKEQLEEEGIRNEEEVETHTSLFNKNYSSGMENCIKRAQDGDFPSLEEIQKGIMAETEDAENRKIPHITDLIMLLTEGRFPELDSDNETIEKMKEHFIMQYPKLQEFFVEDVEELKNTSVVKYLDDENKINKVKRIVKNCCVTEEPLRDKVTKYIEDHDGTEADVKFVKKLIAFIKDKKEFGAYASELKANFNEATSLDLVDLLQYLVDLGVILKTGVSKLVYVHHEHRSEWLIETFMLTPKEKEVFESKEKHEMKKLKVIIEERLKSSSPLKVQLKPWSKLDGSLNDEVFYEWLCIMLSYCINYPNIPFLTICEHFHYVKPVDVYLLLEVLQELGCVYIYLYNNIENNLLSTRCIIDECQATCLDSFENMFVKPTNVSGLCFGSFLNKDILELVA